MKTDGVEFEWVSGRPCEIKLQRAMVTGCVPSGPASHSLKAAATRAVQS